MAQRLTFSRISPNWSKAVNKFLKGKVRRIPAIIGLGKNRHRLNNFACCIVGEAHDYSDGYRKEYGWSTDKYCETCLSYSREFYQFRGNKAMTEWLVEGFTSHWNEVHV